LTKIISRAAASRGCSEDLSSGGYWLRELPGGLRENFDYRIVSCVADANNLILTLPRCDRGQAALGLYHHRSVVGAEVAYSGIMAGWDHGHHEIIEAFGSADQFITALKDVAPALDLYPRNRVEIWRGTVLDTADPLAHSVGLSWTRSRNIACWFALYDYVPALQPSLIPVVLRAIVDPSTIVAMHDARAEQEVIVNVTGSFFASNKIYLEGGDTPLASEATITRLEMADDAFDHLMTSWQLASDRYQHWKNMLERRRRLVSALDLTNRPFCLGNSSSLTRGELQC
jgi:hypothetical protein